MQNGDTVRILVTNSNPHVRGVVKGVLRALGHSEATVTGSRRQALEVLAKRSKDIVIMDDAAEIADADGALDWDAFVRAARSVSAARIILLLNEDDEGTRQAARGLGLGAVLLCPFTVEGLTRRLTALAPRPAAAA